MYVIGYTLVNPDADPFVVHEEWEVFSEFRSSFYRMIEDKKDDEDKKLEKDEKLPEKNNEKKTNQNKINIFAP